jgi:pantoate--beta-alanine ligase
MGALHDGHLGLVRQAAASADKVVVSIFVNPAQFAPQEDFGRYPRAFETDIAKLEHTGAVQLVYAPNAGDMYPEGFATKVSLDGPASGLETAFRPHFFAGVATVVTKLFSIVGPCRAYFGRKDAQQLAVVRRMSADLDLPVEVVGCPLVREADGLALSSRNAYLSADERRAAPVLFRALRAVADAVTGGRRDAAGVREIVETTVATEPSVDLEYVEVRDAEELGPIVDLEGDVLIALAARLGATRLIDNIGLTIRGTEVAVDLGA